MGFLKSLGKLMAKAAPSSSATVTDWENNLTEEEIVALEKQGCDMTEIRKRNAEYKAAKKAEEEKLINDSLAMIDMGKLSAYIATPRDTESEFVNGVVALNGLSKKRKEKLAEAPVVYGAVVQAHNGLWKPGNTTARMGIVFVFAMDKEHMHNEAFLRGRADKIAELKETIAIPPDCEKFINTLRDDQSMFCFKVGESISEGADLWCATYAWPRQSAETLPLSYLPATHIVPLMLLDYPEVNQFAEFEVIPAKFYTK